MHLPCPYQTFKTLAGIYSALYTETIDELRFQVLLQLHTQFEVCALTGPFEHIRVLSFCTVHLCQFMVVFMLEVKPPPPSLLQMLSSTSFLVPADKKHPQVMLPPPCFTMWIVFSGSLIN